MNSNTGLRYQGYAPRYSVGHTFLRRYRGCALFYCARLGLWRTVEEVTTGIWICRHNHIQRSNSSTVQRFNDQTVQQCVAAKSLNRKYIGIDLSEDAVQLTNDRLEKLVISDSNLLKNGIDSYIGKSEKDLGILKSIGAVPVQRNTGIDGFLKQQINGKPIPVRIQKDFETLDDTIRALDNSTQAKKSEVKIIIQTNDTRGLFQLDTNAVVLPSNELIIKEKLQRITMYIGNGGDVQKIGQL